MRRFQLQGSPDAADADGLANDVTLATSATLATNTVATDGLGHLVTITGNAATDHSGKTVTVTGKLFGVTVSDTFAGPNGTATVTSSQYFTEVTSVVISATAGADTFDIGWAVAACTDWKHVGRIQTGSDFKVGFACHILSGSPTYSVQQTYGDSANSYFTHSTVSGETSDQSGSITDPIEAFRLAWSAAGSVEMVGNWTH